MNLYTKYQTRFGQGLLQWREGYLVAHHLPGTMGAGGTGIHTVEVTRGAAQLLTEMLAAYFAGKRVDFAALNLPVARETWTEFQQALAGELTKVPYGETISYGDLASCAGYPRAARAVGNFMAANPLPVILPCHRVIKADGTLGRYSAGAPYKRRLLKLEGASSDREAIGYQAEGFRSLSPVPMWPQIR